MTIYFYNVEAIELRSIAADGRWCRMNNHDPYPRDGKDVHCPWQIIAKCPLYIASHEGKGFGCVGDAARPCIVARGEDSYHRMTLNLIRAGFVPDDAGHLANLAVAGVA